MSSHRLDQAGPMVIWSGSSFTKWMGRSSLVGATSFRNASTRASALRPVACSSSFRVIAGDTFVVARARRHRARKIRSLVRSLRSIADSLPRVLPRADPALLFGSRAIVVPRQQPGLLRNRRCARSAPPVRITQQSLLLSGSPVPSAPLTLGRRYAHAVDEDQLPTQPATEAQE